MIGVLWGLGHTITILAVGSAIILFGLTSVVAMGGGSITNAVISLCLGLLIWAMLLPASQAYQYGDTKMELPIPIYALWIVALLSMAGTMFCALIALLARPATAGPGRAG